MPHQAYFRSLNPVEKVKLLHASLGHPSAEWMKRMLRGGAFSSWGVKPIHVEEAKIRGCNSCARAKDTLLRHFPSKGKLPTKVGSDFHCDVAFVFELMYLIAVESVTRHISIKLLESTTVENLEEAMRSVGSDYDVLGWAPQGSRTYHWDAESGARSMALKSNGKPGLCVVTTAGGQHEKIAEATTKTLHNSMRAAFMHHPFLLPTKLAAFLFEHTIQSLNHRWADGMKSSRWAVVHKTEDSGEFLGLPFATPVYIKAPEAGRTLLSERNELGLLVGRSTTQHKYRVYMLGTGRARDADEVFVATLDEDLIRVLNAWAENGTIPRESDFLRLAKVEDIPQPAQPTRKSTRLAKRELVESMGGEAGFGSFLSMPEGEFETFIAAEELEVCFLVERIVPVERVGDKEGYAAAGLKEAQNLLDYNVFNFLSTNDKSWVGKNLVPVTVVTTEKVDAEGGFIKFRARICARGDRQVVNEWTATSSSVVAHHTLIVLLNRVVSSPVGSNEVGV